MHCFKLLSVFLSFCFWSEFSEQIFTAPVGSQEQVCQIRCDSWAWRSSFTRFNIKPQIKTTVWSLQSFNTRSQGLRRVAFAQHKHTGSSLQLSRFTNAPKITAFQENSNLWCETCFQENCTCRFVSQFCFFVRPETMKPNQTKLMFWMPNVHTCTKNCQSTGIIKLQ